MSSAMSRSYRPVVGGLLAALGFYLVGYVAIWQWMVCRVDVPAGHSLLIRYKGPWPFGSAPAAPENTLVKVDSSGRPTAVGILEAMPGPGRHFYTPLEYETRVVPDTLIPPGKLGVVVSKVGKEQEAGKYLVDEDGFKGIRRRVLTPGRYRLNAYAYEVRVVDVDACVEPTTRVKRAETDPTMIPPGYVGVVTNKTDNPATKELQGIQKDVLQPGIYFLNPEEKRVDVISVGFNESTLTVETDQNATAARRTEAAAAAKADARGDRLGRTTGIDPVYTAGKGIEFPSNDGFLIHLDFTAIWGITPEQAPNVVRQFGGLKDVEQKVVLPQIGSICRMHGSKQGAVDLLVGETREQFQDQTAAELEKVLGAKNLTLLFGLTRHIYVPAEVREPIQRGKIADELTKTREQEQLTAQAQAELTEAEAKVVLEQRKTEAETLKMVAKVEAEGEKKAREIEAETGKLQAEIDAKTATIEAQTTKLLGEAEAKKVELSRAAEADRFKQYVTALGSPEAYNKYVFAEGLASDLKLGVFYAGQGTFWTDLKGVEQVMLGKLASESEAKPGKPSPAVDRVMPTSSGPATGR
ncbi:MAG: SPFH domain-containing protein [Isosphaeraceae bacterium]